MVDSGGVSTRNFIGLITVRVISPGRFRPRLHHKPARGSHEKFCEGAVDARDTCDLVLCLIDVLTLCGRNRRSAASLRRRSESDPLSDSRDWNRDSPSRRRRC